MDPRTKPRPCPFPRPQPGPGTQWTPAPGTSHPKPGRLPSGGRAETAPPSPQDPDPSQGSGQSISTPQRTRTCHWLRVPRHVLTCRVGQASVPPSPGSGKAGLAEGLPWEPPPGQSGK